MKVLCILTDGFEDIEAIGTISILRRAKIDVDIFSLNKNDATGRYITHMIDLLNSNSINDISSYDLLFIPGGPQYLVLEKSNLVKSLIVKFYEANKYIAGICAAPTLFGHLGLLQGKKYTCFTSMNEDFGGTYLDKYAVKDENIITGKSAAATIDFAFLIVESLVSKNYAEQVKNSIFYYNKD